MDWEKLREMAHSCGFTNMARLDCHTIELMPQVRQMCELNTCRMYNRRWSCPPGCGTLEECAARIGAYRSGLIVQTVAELEDALDGEGMMEAEARHKRSFAKLRSQLEKDFPMLLAIGAGCCTECGTCTYPDAPCRFPKLSVSSMEAYGILVTQVCSANGLQYYYGPNTISYTSCFCLE